MQPRGLAAQGLKGSIAQQPVTNSRHSEKEAWCVIGNVAIERLNPS